MKKLLVFSVFLLAMFAALVSANINTVQLIAPTNASYDGDATIAFTAQVTGTEAGVNYSCYL